MDGTRKSFLAAIRQELIESGEVSETLLDYLEDLIKDRVEACLVNQATEGDER